MTYDFPEEDFPVEDGTDSTLITKPGENDVLCGRGGGTNNHAGNIKFRAMVNEHKLRYLAASKVEKPKVAREVVNLWRGMTPPGRFLTRKNDAAKGPGSVKAEGVVWIDVGDKKAREKASQCLRERTPDVIPFVKELQRQQDFITGHGLKFVEQQMREQKQQEQQVANGGGARVHPISDSDVANAFDVNHFQNQGGFHSNMNPTYTTSMQLPGTSQQPQQPDTMLQMSQDEVNQWFMQNADLDPAPLPVSGGQPAFNGDLGADDLRMPMPDLMPSNIEQMNDMSALDFGASAGSLGITGTEDEMTLEEYQKSLEEYLQSNNLTDNKTSSKKRTKNKSKDKKSKPGVGLEEYRQNSWVKSFHSIETKDSVVAPVKKRGTALENTIQRSQGLHAMGRSTRTNMTTGTEKSAMSAMSGMSGISLFSDMSEESHNTTRSTKMNMASQFTSNLSMMSEMTDLSETLNSMDLNQPV